MKNLIGEAVQICEKMQGKETVPEPSLEISDTIEHLDPNGDNAWWVEVKPKTVQPKTKAAAPVAQFKTDAPVVAGLPGTPAAEPTLTAEAPTAATGGPPEKSRLRSGGISNSCDMSAPLLCAPYIIAVCHAATTPGGDPPIKSKN